MAEVKLNHDELTLKSQITDFVNELRKKFRSNDQEYDFRSKINQNAKLCYELHMKLKARGIEPRHHKYMIQNRGASPDSVEFYDHFHPQEDLLKFLDDQNANNDPVDATIGETFTFTFFSKRWGHDDTIKMIRNENGWYVSFIGIEGQCDKSGDPYLFKNLKHELVSYPRNLSSYISSIWDRAERGMDKESVQQMLNSVADWVSETEKNSPDGILV